MKKLILITILVAFMAAPALAGPSLGWWDEPTDPPVNATHQMWDFTNRDDSGALVTSVPEVIISPSHAVAKIVLGELDPGQGIITGQVIQLIVEVENFPRDNAYKEIWVDLDFEGGTLDLQSIGAVGTGPYGPYTTEILLETGPRGEADFGFIIRSNPWIEDIGFKIIADSTADPAVLSSMHIDTICIPAPGAILLGSIGVGLVGWLRRRRTL